LIINLRPFLF
jgi:hypothetical protein